MKHRSHARRAGFTLFEVMITVAIIALISGGIALAVHQRSTEARVRLTKTHAETVRNGVKMTSALDGALGCPSFETLIEHEVLEENSPRHDPWGNPWRIECDGSKVTVTTSGPDRQPGTADDIRVPSR
jgi:prepilin-type N-terminal cleavage/methylation domain-containing protein